MTSRSNLIVVFALVGWPVCLNPVVGQEGLRERTATSASEADRRKEEYVCAVTRGEGFLSWQARGVSDAEKEFRESIECRKTEMLADRIDVMHPVLLSRDNFEQARRNMNISEIARSWYASHKDVADYVVRQPVSYVDRMIPELTPTSPYGFTCPHCVGKASQEGVGVSLMSWDYRQPEVCRCRKCGQVYPSTDYPESGRLVCPRQGQEFTFYLNDQERRYPEDRSGRHAWHWVGRPVHVSFTGIIREEKIKFMIGAARSLGLTYQFTSDPRYARRAIEILVRMAKCYRKWLYHDYWGSFADCDPMYAVWHDRQLPLEWKRHQCSDAYKEDTLERARMLKDYWGAGRIHPSTDAISLLAQVATAYDLLSDARDEQGRIMWSSEDQSLVERDLILEYIMGAEPFVGGAGKATNVNNKAPRVYRAQAAVARCLGLPALADTALRGYEAVRDESFLYDGFSRESPSYTNMYLSELVLIPETLHGFQWPEDFSARRGTVNVYEDDARLELMFRAMIDQVRPDGRYPPLSDTMTTSEPSSHLLEVGRKRYPARFEQVAASLCRDRSPSEYAILNLPVELPEPRSPLLLPEVCFPAWMTAFVRHGRGENSAMLAMTFSPMGTHRHDDNLAIFYLSDGRMMLGDHGYVGDMPVNGWIHSTLSHNLVIVDDAGQQRYGRHPELRRMLISPKVSVVEASSKVYDQCHDYRRLTALIKGPVSRTFAVDVFRVKGCQQRHDYRLFSELASSDAADGHLYFDGLTMPEEAPLPEVGASIAREDIFGLRDTRVFVHPPGSWQACWQEADRRFRVWMLCEADRVEASNGPGQETRGQAGRRVRYLDVIREGRDLQSTFVAIHEPGGLTGGMSIRRAERLPVPVEAGPEAVAVRIESDWGTYVVLNEFENVTDVAGIRFAGSFAVICHTPEGRFWMVTSEASTCWAGESGFRDEAAMWCGSVTGHDQTGFLADAGPPEGWQTAPAGVTPYVLVKTDEYWTGFPVQSVERRRIAVDRFPLPAISEFKFAHVRLIEQD